ncbi:Hvo_1808 family surface protein [Halorubrum sp. BV1]|uniref:Hvo_1808 family surface protein n=1 Tax=Halorubrum sp. BV1 TaxID=1498500 RepID=UPI0006790B71|nr:Hvo_1808 family surface protein [Halorubrum sp. BV1]
MRRVHTLSFVLAAIALLAVGGVAGGAVGDVADASSPTLASEPPTPTAASVSGPEAVASATPATCDTDDNTAVVGCWNGTHYEDELSFDQDDGLTEAELEALTHLTMARVEHIRQRPFREGVPVETVTRAEFTNGSMGGDGADETNGSVAASQRWNDQVWEALFVVGEDTTAAEEIDTVFGGAVSGFYSPTQDSIVLVVSEGEAVQIDPSTLAHELVHGMQDQYHDLTRARYVGATQDRDLAVDGIVEGEAVHIEERYAARCADNWTCIDGPSSGGGGGGSASEYNFGILQTVLQPYAEGAFYVESLVEAEGWSAVNETMTTPPESTAEVIHERPGYETRAVEFEDTATDGWETYPDQGVDGAETAGEASMFVMFWYQSFEYGYPVLEPTGSRASNVRIHTRPEASLRTRVNYNYAHEATAGWAGDELYPYRNDDGGETRDGYIWVTEWQTRADATAFYETYRTMLEAHGDDPYVTGDVYAIDDGDFPGAYGVSRENTTVTIVHAPEPGGVLELRPGIGLDLPGSTDGPVGEPDDDETDGGVGSGNDGGSGFDGADRGDGSGPDSETGGGAGEGESNDAGESSTAEETPGFGVAAALAAVVATVAVLARRRR